MQVKPGAGAAPVGINGDRPASAVLWLTATASAAARLAAGDMMSKSWPQSPRRAMISRLACDEGPRRRT